MAFDPRSFDPMLVNLRLLAVFLLFLKPPFVKDLNILIWGLRKIFYKLLML